MISAEANEECLRRLSRGRPILCDLRPAREVADILREKCLLHAGPPIEWERMCGPMQGGAEMAVVYEGWAANHEAARSLLQRGTIAFEPTHDHGFVGPVAGIVSSSMWVLCVRDEVYDNWAYCTMSEGMGRALRFGAQGPDVLAKLKWMETVLAPILGEAVRLSGGIDLGALMANALEMGDECHNRHEAARLLLLRELTPHLLSLRRSAAEIESVFSFIAGNYYFFVNLAMAACKAVARSIDHVRGSSIVSVMARNGRDFGIRVAGLGTEWFTGPCRAIRGKLFEGFSPADRNKDLGDSTITETVGLGAFAMAAAPAICRYIGGTARDMIDATLMMYKITAGEHERYKIPYLEYRGSPTGIDIKKVVMQGITPVINTSIAHKNPGVGQIGAGRTKAPIVCFKKALRVLEGIESR